MRRRQRDIALDRNKLTPAPNEARPARPGAGFTLFLGPGACQDSKPLEHKENDAMTLALLILVAVAVSFWRASHVKQHASPAAGPSGRERELGGLRDRYVAEDITLDEFEGQVADALEGRPTEATQYTEHWEINVYDAPAGHHLHIHLP